MDVSIFRVQIHTVKSVKTGLGTLIDFGIDVKVDLDELLTVEDVTIKETKPLTSTLIMHKIQAPFSSLSHEQLLDKSRSHYFSKMAEDSLKNFPKDFLRGNQVS